MSDVTFTAIAAIMAGMALGTLVKGVTGGGLPMVAIPVIATFLGVEEAVVIMAIPTVLTNVWMTWTTRAAAKRAQGLGTLVATGILGAVIGVGLLASLDERWLSVVLAAVILVYLLQQVFRPGTQLNELAAGRLRPVAGLVSGLLQGAMGVSSPPMIMYLHAQRLDRQLFLFLLTFLISLTGVAQAVTMGFANLYDPGRLLFSGLAMVPIAVLLPIAMRLGNTMPRRYFDLLVRLLLAGAAARLIFDAVTG